MVITVYFPGSQTPTPCADVADFLLEVYREIYLIYDKLWVVKYPTRAHIKVRYDKNPSSVISTCSTIWCTRRAVSKYFICVWLFFNEDFEMWTKYAIVLFYCRTRIGNLWICLSNYYYLSVNFKLSISPFA